MNVKVKASKGFQRQAKKLLKKYPSLKKELRELETDLLKDPESGTPLGQNAFKIRVKISSKGKGKSGGARVITYVDTMISIDEKTVTLLTIYDKSETAAITNKELSTLIKNL
jgi:mRNA-degrading endonuclease RelE of RelBE toxin-antitoxin system